jgi:hypothetical protein
MRKEAALILFEYSKHMSEQGTGAKFRMKKKPASSSSAKGFPPPLSLAYFSRGEI